MAWQCDLNFGVVDIENDMRLVPAVGGRDENRMFVRKISNDELLFGFHFRAGGDRVLSEAERSRFPGYYSTVHWLIKNGIMSENTLIRSSEKSLKMLCRTTQTDLVDTPNILME